MKQVTTSEKNKRGLNKENQSKGGSVTKTQILQRQAHVERLMRMGYTLTRIVATTVNDKKLGSSNVLSNDMKLIQSRWLEADPGWMIRANLARIEAKNRLLEQLIRLGDLILEIKAGTYNTQIKTNKKGGSFTIEANADLPKKLVYAESQLTTVISKIYEIDADFDPEQYLDKKIEESLHDKIKERKTKIS